MIQKLQNALHGHETWRRECINLVASENALSPLARSALQSDMGQRYYFEEPFNSGNGISYTYRGTDYISKIVKAGEQAARQLFHAEYASLYPLSGHQANLGVLLAFCKSGDTIMCTSPAYGGYPGLDTNKLPGYLNLNVENIPVYSEASDIIDVPSTCDMIAELRPVILILSSAHTLFPVPLRELASVCSAHNCLLVYDGSHPLGLIAGQHFQNPMNEGADVLLGGTQKSFPGPQGGIIVTSKHEDKIREVEHFVMVDNPHFHRIAALTCALVEMIEFGEQYARQIVLNSKALAGKLDGAGLPVRYKDRGYTESHMLKLDTFDGYHVFTQDLEKANVILDNSGRIGTNEMTRYGMKEREMCIIGEFIARVYSGENPSDVKKDAIDFRMAFQQVTYCFDGVPMQAAL